VYLRATAVLTMLALAGCASPPYAPSTTPGPTQTPTPSPTVTCGDILPAECGPAASAVFSALGGQSLAPTTVDLNNGSLCAVPELLFERALGCPSGPAGGGEWIGNAEVTFGEAAEHAYLNITKNGQTVGALLIAIATPPPSP
jgi:hypothetical protein